MNTPVTIAALPVLIGGCGARQNCFDIFEFAPGSVAPNRKTPTT